jgi:DNA-binding NtrC family response regulator
MSKLRILIADDEKPARFGMMKALASDDYQLAEAVDGPAALDALRSRQADLAFLDLNMPGLDGRAVLAELGVAARDTEIIVVTANDSVTTAVECIRLGAADYLTKPFEIARLRAIARRAAERLALQRRVIDLQAELNDERACGALVGISRPMRELFRQMTRAARAPIDVLIRGETGTGKELIARELHRLSDRAAGPFVAVNTAAIAESLAESELFGHVPGAFTGAVAERRGVFEQANGGTLFLDEIGDMPLAAQTKILRALENRTIQPVGSARSVAVDVRVVSATHQDLEQAIASGQFRQDLYYRIRGVELWAPPLRSRPEDILLLANFFLERTAERSGAAPLRLSAEAVEQLLRFVWPGNVRQLQQVLAAAAVLADGKELSARELNLPGKLVVASPEQDFAAWKGLPLSEAKVALVEAFERSMICAALEEHQDNVSAAARQLGIHRQSLQQKMAQLGLRRE